MHSVVWLHSENVALHITSRLFVLYRKLFGNLNKLKSNFQILRYLPNNCRIRFYFVQLFWLVCIAHRLHRLLLRRWRCPGIPTLKIKVLHWVRSSRSNQQRHRLDFCCLLTSPFEVDKPEVGATRGLENMREMFKPHTCMKKMRRFNTLSALLSYYYLKNTQE